MFVAYLFLSSVLFLMTSFVLCIFLAWPKMYLSYKNRVINIIFKMTTALKFRVDILIKERLNKTVTLKLHYK